MMELPERVRSISMLLETSRVMGRFISGIDGVDVVVIVVVVIGDGIDHGICRGGEVRVE